MILAAPVRNCNWVMTRYGFICIQICFCISPDNPAYRYSYLRDDEYRSRCAVIHVYNFLSDPLAERRSDDYGMLIARILSTTKIILW